MKNLYAALQDQITFRHVRLACELIMFTYLAGHLTMHALGNISWQAMDAGAHVHDFIWHSAAGTTVLYGAFTFHFGLALWALYDRRSFQMRCGEWGRLLLGFSILPLLFHHFTAGRYVYSAFGVQRSYDVVLTAYFRFVPWWGWRQIIALLIAWTHGCLGIHIWLRIRPWYRKFQPIPLTAAVLLPVFALSRNWQGVREVLAYGHAHPDWLQSVVRNGHMRDPAVGGASWKLEVELYWAFGLLVAAVFAARAIRWLLEYRLGLIGITYPSGRRVRGSQRVLRARRQPTRANSARLDLRRTWTVHNVPCHRFTRTTGPTGAEPMELTALTRLRVSKNVRLACQLRPQNDVSVLLLLPPNITASDRRRAERR